MNVGIATAYFGGLLTLFAPCAAMMIPGFLAYAASERKHLLGRTALFTFGLVVALTPLGFLAGSLGAAIRLNQATLTAWLGVLVVVLGLWQALALPFPHFSRGSVRRGRDAARVAPISGVNLPGVKAVPASKVGSVATVPVEAKSSNPLAVFALGVGYGLAGVGCSGPILGAMLSLTVGARSSLAGGLMMVFYALGMATPVVILAILWESLRLSERSFMKPKPLRFLGRWTTRGAVISGFIFVLLGLLMVFTGGHNFLPSVISTGTQVEWESSLISSTANIPWWLFALLLVVVITAVWVWKKYYRTSNEDA